MRRNDITHTTQTPTVLYDLEHFTGGGGDGQNGGRGLKGTNFQLKYK